MTQIYNPAIDAWSTGTSPQVPINLGDYGLAAAATATTGELAPKRVYVYDGATLQIYDPQVDSWANGAAPPTSRQNVGMTTVEDLVYVIGGVSYPFPGYPELHKANEQYTPIGYGTPTESPSISEYSLIALAVLLVVTVVALVVGLSIYLKRYRR